MNKTPATAATAASATTGAPTRVTDDFITAEAAAPDGSVEALEVGRAVRLQNLASKPELNGKPGVVAVKANENGRDGVRVAMMI